MVVLWGLVRGARNCGARNCGARNHGGQVMRAGLWACC